MDWESSIWTTFSGFSIVVKSDPLNLKIFVWKEESSENNIELEGSFFDQIIDNNFQSYNQENIEITEESFQMSQLSEEFLSYFT